MLPTMPPETFTFDRMATPLGETLLLVDAAGSLCALDWDDYEPRLHRLLARFHGAARLERGEAPAIRMALRRYFDGDLHAIDRVPVRMLGGSAFQRRVWQALREIAVGTTTSYGLLAGRIGAPKAVRAVGMANGANPIGLVVPCHRVIGADGSLTGYGGGLERKSWLLRHEGAIAAERRQESLL